ncbi:hypothetical protein PQU96_09825 [Vogesella sp. LYT5W]|uniref:Uncharacterized protein n=1 Tax=Vogesella margarita TaxID=2984199 RepID=A0ABT5IQ65_9NEIS|nr:hypothetical protein [Vogesella margarita]MDC7714425.1 hypothetical protein [Vogesella margarita]
MNQATRSQPTSGLPSFRIRHLSEAEIETVVTSAGGTRAHPDADRRNLRGADFVLGSSVIELKILEDEGLDKPERQQKLAKLFRERFPARPTVVLDRGLLDAQGQRTYDRIVEGPVKTAVSSARQQLQQSRLEYTATSTVLWVINNGYSSLSHSALMELVARRARNDSSDIDAVVVSGAYFYSDTFDSFFLWPIDCTSIHPDKPFQDFEALRDAWNEFAMDRMTALLREPAASEETKGPVVDISFQLEGVTYVMPAPPMGRESGFFTNGRPRNNSTGITSSPPVATIFAGLSHQEWTEFKRHHTHVVSSADYNEWKMKEALASSKCNLKPFITIPVTYAGWWEWARNQPQETRVSVHRYANDLFQQKILGVIDGARERTDDSVFPRRYMLLITEEIGQDLAFDVSHLAEVWVLPDGSDHIDEVWTNKPMFFEQALTITAAEAIARGVECVFWEKDKTYAWN